MKKLINYGPKDFERHILVTSSIIRGIENILKALPDGSYINFLKDNRLLDPLVKKVAQYTQANIQGLNSVEHLEQLADLLRDEVMASEKLSMTNYNDFKRLFPG